MLIKYNPKTERLFCFSENFIIVLIIHFSLFSHLKRNFHFISFITFFSIAAFSFIRCSEQVLFEKKMFLKHLHT